MAPADQRLEFQMPDPTPGATVAPPALHARRVRTLIWYWGRRGGGPNYTFEITRALMARGDLDLHLSLSRQSDMFERFATLNLPSFDVDTYHDAPSALRSLTRLPALRRAFEGYLRRNAISVVICTMAHLWNPVMLPTIRRAGARYILTVHDAVLHPGERQRIYQHWLNYEIRRADGIITLTNHVRNELVLRHGFRADYVVRAPHGPFSAAVPEGETSPRPHYPRRLLFFGRIIEYKGLDILLGAFRSLQERYPDLTLRICGGGNVSPYMQVLATLERASIDNRYIPEEEIPGILREADIVVLPYREASQSGVIALAQTAGIPVVVTPVGGLVEQVINFRTGIIAQEASAPALAAAVSTLIDDPELYRRCAFNIRELSANIWEEAATTVSNLIHKIADRKPS